MKVAMVGHKVVPSRRGGIENVLTNLCPLLIERGTSVTCYNRSSDRVENEYIGMVKDKKYKGVTLKNAWTVSGKGLSAMVASFTAAILATFSRVASTLDHQSCGDVLFAATLFACGFAL